MSITIPDLYCGEKVSIHHGVLTLLTPTTHGLYVENTALCSDGEDVLAMIFEHVRSVASGGPAGAIKNWVDGNSSPVENALIRDYLGAINRSVKTLRREHGLKLAECAELLQSFEL